MFAGPPSIYAHTRTHTHTTRLISLYSSHLRSEMRQNEMKPLLEHSRSVTRIHLTSIYSWCWHARLIRICSDEAKMHEIQTQTPSSVKAKLPRLSSEAIARCFQPHLTVVHAQCESHTQACWSNIAGGSKSSTWLSSLTSHITSGGDVF